MRTLLRPWGELPPSPTTTPGRERLRRSPSRRCSSRWSPRPARPSSRTPSRASKRIVAVGDVHGGYDEFVGNPAGGGRDRRVESMVGRQDAPRADRRSRGPRRRLPQGQGPRDAARDGGPRGRRTRPRAARQPRGDEPHRRLALHVARRVRAPSRRSGRATCAIARTRHSRIRPGRTIPPTASSGDMEHPLGWVEHRQAYGAGWAVRQVDSPAQHGGEDQRLPVPARRHRTLAVWHADPRDQRSRCAPKSSRPRCPRTGSPSGGRAIVVPRLRPGPEDGSAAGGRVARALRRRPHRRRAYHDAGRRRAEAGRKDPA